MLYNGYLLQQAWLAHMSAYADYSAELLQSPVNPLSYIGAGPLIASGLEVFAHAAAPRGKPAFGLDRVTHEGRDYHFHEEIVLRKPFGQLKHFVRDNDDLPRPKLLVVAPMSGHYATLLRGTVARLLPHQDVYITDWRDAKLVPLGDGLFDLDSYIDYLVEFLEAIGPGAHMLAVCQPSVPAFAAACLMSTTNNPARPRTLTMMGGPIDTREAPTTVNTLATERPHAWFAHNAIARVPFAYPGAGRAVYPGFLQLAGFMSMNLGNHMISHWEMFKHLVIGDEDSSDTIKTFYEEYRSVCDMTAEFYLQTVRTVFQDHALPRGEMMHRGVRIDPGALHDVALLAIEGERDDISGVGQTRAALTIANGLAEGDKQYMLVEGAGHYGIFNGSRWRNQVAPVVEQWIADHDAATGRAPVGKRAQAGNRPR